MGSRSITGIVLLVLGVAFVIIGANASNSFADQVTNTFTGHFTDHTTWYLLGGGALGLTGLLLLLTNLGGKKA